MIIRPGLIVGPHDPTDRFTYWVRRMANGGEVLAPESPDVARTQVIPVAAGLESRPIEAVVADLAAWDRARRQEPLRAGMSREREAELLRTFRAEDPPPGP